MNSPRRGRTRYLVTVEQITGQQDATGQELKVWSTLTTGYVSIEEPSGMERLVGQQIYAEAQVTIWGGFVDFNGTMPKMRVIFPNPDVPGAKRIFDIKAVMDPDGKRHWLKMDCVERVESGNPGQSGSPAPPTPGQTAPLVVVKIVSPRAEDFQIANPLGSIPGDAQIRMTSLGLIVFQSALEYDAQWIYLNASDVGLTADLLLWGSS